MNLNPRFNNDFKTMLELILEEINFFRSFDAKIYPKNSIYPPNIFRSKLMKFSKKWSDEWLYFLEEYIFKHIDRSKILKFIDNKDIYIAEIISIEIELIYIENFHRLISLYADCVKLYEIEKTVELEGKYSEEQTIVGNVVILKNNPIDIILEFSCLIEQIEGEMEIKMELKTRLQKYRLDKLDKNIDQEIKDEIVDVTRKILLEKNELI